MGEYKSFEDFLKEVHLEACSSTKGVQVEISLGKLKNIRGDYSTEVAYKIGKKEFLEIRKLDKKSEFDEIDLKEDFIYIKNSLEGTCESELISFSLEKLVFIVEPCNFLQNPSHPIYHPNLYTPHKPKNLN